MHVKVNQSCLTLCVACQAPLSMEFSKQEYWSGLPFPSPEDLPTHGSNLGLLHCRKILLHCLSHQGSPYCIYSYAISLVLFFLFGILSSLLFIWFPLLNIKTKPCSLILVIVANPNYANVLLNSVCVCMCVCVSFDIEEILKHNSISQE